MNDELLWMLSRASGVVTLVLLTGVVALGTLTAIGRMPRGQSATLVIATHRLLGLGTAAFLLVHIVSAVVDGYVDLPWTAALVPFTSGYEPVWVGLGTLTADILLAVIVTSLLRHRIPEHVWRRVHWFTYAMWPIAVLHGFAMGTADHPGLRYTTIVCGLVGTACAVARLWVTSEDAQVRERLATGWA